MTHPAARDPVGTPPRSPDPGPGAPPRPATPPAGPSVATPYRPPAGRRAHGETLRVPAGALRWIIALSVGAVLAAACSPSATPTRRDGPSASTATTGPSASPTSPRPTAPAAPGTGTGDPGPVDGGTLVAAVRRPSSLDPLLINPTEPGDILVVDLLFDGLTRTDPATGEAVGALAESWGPTDEDARTWRFTLRADAVFHDGTPVTAADVVHSLERVARLGPVTPAGAALEIIEGVRDRTGDDIAGITAVDERTVEIRLADPTRLLPAILANPQLGIVPAGSDDPARDPPFGVRPVGTGPFAFAGADGDTVHLTATGTAPVHLDGVDVVFTDDLEAAYQAFEDGVYDWVPVPPDRIADAAGRFTGLRADPRPAVLFYGFNLGHPALADRDLRRAVLAAVDRRRIVTDVYRETVDPLDGVVPAGLRGRNPDPCGELCRHDPETARQLVAAAGDVGEITIDYDASTVQEAVASRIRDDLAAVGLTAVLRPRDPDAHAAAVAGGDVAIFRLGWVAGYLHADAVLSPLFRTGVPDNATGYSDPLVDLALAEARTTADPEARDARFAEVEAAVMDAVAVLPIAQFRTHVLVAPRVRDLRTNPDGTIDAAAVWLEP